MKKIIKIFAVMTIVLMLSLTSTMVFAEPPEPPAGEMPGQNGGTPPDKPDGNEGGPGENNSSNISHTGATEISSDTEDSEQVYSSTMDSQNALLVTGGTSTITNSTITKSGDSDGDNADFYGTNAAVLVKEGTLSIVAGTVNTSGSHANGIFAYSKGTINVSDTDIKTSSNNSGAIMVTGGGTLTANEVTAETEGNSSAPIRSDRGGGTLTVNGGEYISHGTGSPAIYSTADITANNTILSSTASEGVVVEGKNSVTLNKTIMEATNTTLNGNSETYKGIFIYQSMSGDADVGTASFKAKDSKIINNKGDVIFVTNTSTTIDLENNEIVNNDVDGAFMRISAAKWGTSGSNGGNVKLTANTQELKGNVLVDNISTLDFSLKNGSSYEGKINNENSAKKISITLDSSSTLTLTGDCYITDLYNDVSDNSNINLNGYNLYVNGTAIEAANYKGATALSSQSNIESNNYTENSNNTTNNTESNSKENAIIEIGAAISVIIVLGAGVAFVFKKITRKE